MYITFEQLFDRLRYPAGETHLRLRGHDQQEPGQLTIEVSAYNFDDLGQIVTADRLLGRNGITAEWFVPYFPFARHDRRIDARDGFELEVAMGMIADLDVVIADGHSDVVGQLPQFDQCNVVNVFRKGGVFDGDPIVVVPDAGAAKKAYEWAGCSQVVQCLKHRDQRTGKLSGFGVLADDLGGRSCIIVDDICDGGGTFLGVAAELNKLNAGSLTLAVTHGLFTKGTDPLLETFDRLITFAPASRPSPESRPAWSTNPRITRFDFQTLYETGIRK